MGVILRRTPSGAATSAAWIVYRRLRRVKQEHATEFRQLIRDEACHVNAERVFFKRFARP